MITGQSPPKFTAGSFQRQSVFDAYYKLEDGKPVGGGNILAMSSNLLTSDSLSSNKTTVNDLTRQILKSSITAKRQLIPRATVTSSGE